MDQFDIDKRVLLIDARLKIGHITSDHIVNNQKK